MRLSRRCFLGTSASAVLVAGTRAKGKVFGANDRIAIAPIGLRGQGNHLRRELCVRDDVEISALCDVDQRLLEMRLRESKEDTGREPKAFRDVRDLIADDSIDAVCVATPNHWHALIAIWAMQAGKDVYLEKPMSHNVFEGQQLRFAASKYGQIVQHGTQQRSNPEMMRDIKLLQDGFIGDIVHSRGVVYKNSSRYSLGHGVESEPPPFIDWNLWLGPAPERPYKDLPDRDWNELKSGIYVHYNWHWFWDFGSGEIGNQGVHEMDVAVWGHNRGLPVRVSSLGGRFGWDDCGETPNTSATTFTFSDDSMLTFEVRNLGSFSEGGVDQPCGNSFFGTEGYYVRGAGFFDYQNKPIPLEGELAETPPSEGRTGNWLKAVQSRDPEHITSPVDSGHITCTHIHIANIAYRLGCSLEFDSKAERFVDNDVANAMLARDYREPFVVPTLT